MTCDNCHVRPAEPKRTLCRECREHAERLSMRNYAESLPQGPVSKIKVIK